MAPLPASRLKPRTHVFVYAASDLAGPFIVTVGRSSAKHWICSFVCMVTTAIRFEFYLSTSQLSPSLMSSKGFCVLQGFVLNSSLQIMEQTFVGANNLLRREIKAAFKGKVRFQGVAK